MFFFYFFKCVMSLVAPAGLGGALPGIQAIKVGSKKEYKEQSGRSIL
ncbi:MAG: hypothetical protein LBV23_01195 [Deltaproteobacteria bacterium]|nr:hypothetical protein [Deltaproteobacteria bacterium]